MQTTHILGLLVAAGALGAVAGGVVGTMAEQRDSGPDSVLTARLDEVVDGVEDLRDSAADLRNDVADVRERLVAVELELSRRASMPTPIADSPQGDIAAATPDMTPAEREAAKAALRRSTLDLEKRMADVELATARAMEMKERFSKGMKIRAMPEDERWQYAADTLGLNSVQVDELKAAHEELQEGMQAAIVEETNESNGSTFTFRRVDGNKMREAQEAFQSRVDNALNDEQKKAWADEGFAHAMGRSRGVMAFSPRRIRATDGGSEVSTGTIEIVTTETIESSD
jgi:hypothetical protein